jgi:hypothetical protein
MLCQLEMDCTTKTPKNPPMETMGNCMARSALSFWLGVQVLVRGLVSSKSLTFSRVSILVFMVIVQTIGRHSSWFPLDRVDGGSPLLDMDIQGCQLFQFPLIWQNSWQPKDRWFFACDIIQ